MKDRHLYPVDLARPDDLVGSIVYTTKDGEARTEWYYEPMTDEKPKLEKIDKRVYQAIVDKHFLASASVSLFVSLSVSMGDDDKANILIQDLYSLEGPERSKVQDKINAWIKDSAALRPTQAFYCRATRVSLGTSDVYRKVSGNGKVSGLVFGVNGEYYSAMSVYTAKSFVAWDAVPVAIPGARALDQMQAPHELTKLKRHP